VIEMKQASLADEACFIGERTLLCLSMKPYAFFAVLPDKLSHILFVAFLIRQALFRRVRVGQG
jgi:hypothetical protein